MCVGTAEIAFEDNLVVLDDDEAGRIGQRQKRRRVNPGSTEIERRRQVDLRALRERARIAGGSYHDCREEGPHIAEIGDVVPVLEQRARKFDAAYRPNRRAFATDYRERSQDR
jgi:hypothetical protein